MSLSSTQIMVPYFIPENFWGIILQTVLRITASYSKTFGEKKHFGIDVAASKKEKVISAAEGMVVFNGIDSELGKVLVLSHPNGFFTLYGHLDTIFVNNREIINANSVIALVGTTGVTSGPHLHFEIWKDNELIDPRDVIEEYRRKDVSIRQQ